MEREKIRVSLKELKDMYHLNDTEVFDTYVEVKGKSASGKPVLANMSIILEVFA